MVTVTESNEGQVHYSGEHAGVSYRNYCCTILYHRARLAEKRRMGFWPALVHGLPSSIYTIVTFPFYRWRARLVWAWRQCKLQSARSPYAYTGRHFFCTIPVYREYYHTMWLCPNCIPLNIQELNYNTSERENTSTRYRDCTVIKTTQTRMGWTSPPFLNTLYTC